MAEKIILLTNLGSPDSYKVKDLKKYLTQFLMDERVIDIPYLLRALLVKGIIVPFRAPKSAAKYQSIWTENGSPLVQSTKEITQLVARLSGLPAYFCMRYGNPSPETILNDIKKEHPDLKEIILVPLYPHYAMSSYETGVEYVQEFSKKIVPSCKIEIVPPFYKEEEYISALSASIKPYTDKGYDHILFSYHGLPKRHLIKSDPTGNHCCQMKDCCNTESRAHDYCYKHQVTVTTRLVAEKLAIPKEKYSISFQSRLAGDKWISPYTDKELEEFPKKGVKKLIVVCPAFVSDCLETLEEIHLEGRDTFLENGGTEFRAVPCLNAQEHWGKSLCKIINKTSKISLAQCT